MPFPCPRCECKAHLASSKQLDKETREAYWQCMNLKCGTAFVAHMCVGQVVAKNGQSNHRIAM
ncbi:ogr/Delta-like zinc finger family protein [Vibrio mimicus]|uniref:ogr/Delta-like zinc finger family protein n=1 Tax=Vibrio mimicus TaxID=674 RepID=UPI0039E19F91